jgi:hypothetical protein
VVDQPKGAEPFGLRGRRLAAGPAALVEEQRPGDDREREEGGDAGHQRAQPPVRAPDAVAFPFALGPARL